MFEVECPFNLVNSALHDLIVVNVNCVIDKILEWSDNQVDKHAKYMYMPT